VLCHGIHWKSDCKVDEGSNEVVGRRSQGDREGRQERDGLEIQTGLNREISQAVRGQANR
jgi:hypothetical protein